MTHPFHNAPNLYGKQYLMINVGLIGLGRIADLHQLGYVDLPDARIHTVCDVNADLADARRRQWNAAKSCTDYHALLDDPEIDAVEIITPQTVHEPIVIDAAAAGKHIAVQKPMTTSMAAAHRMLDAVRDAGILFKVTDNYLT